ncbi:uncharacterized protein LOC129587977 [Paramacrobiotus metropolitanus]|uniref:uncharacterized protein LOC129587977 n=1 Tax=Paramacrobiotus metropolitanus TaxID=2943436 RepID=UPI002446479F|nr:uncharacterized protein LOC129587977 [Paramacrobiotus metropolitanus]
MEQLTVTVTQHESGSGHAIWAPATIVSQDPINETQPDPAVEGVRRRILLTIAIQTVIIVTVGILIVALAPTVLPVASVPVSVYLIGGVLILTSLVSALSAYRVYTIQSIGDSHTSADLIEALSSMKVQDAKRFPVLYAFRHYNYALLGELGGSVIGVGSEIPGDLQSGQVASIKWPLIAFGAAFVLLVACIIYNFVAADGYAKELQAKRRDFFSFEEMHRRQMEQGAAGAPVTFEPLPAHLPVSSPEETLQTVLRNN